MVYNIIFDQIYVCIFKKTYVTRISSKLTMYSVSVHFRYRTIFSKRSAQGLVFEGILKSQESKVGACLVSKYSFGGPQKYEKNEGLDKKLRFILKKPTDPKFVL